MNQSCILQQGELRRTHRTSEALPAPFAAESLDSLHAVPDALLALLALGHPQTHVASLPVRMALVDREADVVVRERAVARERPRRRARIGRWQERVAALGAEEVLLVIRPLPQLWIVECNEALVDDRRLAVIAFGGELLVDKSFR